ncbi:hypothetical protein NBRC10512_003089 [Rhodotorula toruloides]|uniref:Ribosome biogenesis protein ERB1 n=2 Tax=Rhodotorula toruloides TaxID=5286 RepID=A0A061B079_RHOTO|nr:ribosome biogenesis protein ERB1 [Rhodotorula toruloides NP11]EMS23683.1 ribosome biogenesis protein ERB1 [Rhodotorula toruloides NP11]CDR40995.1 RHTO0S05e10594g1_1 [Rhodotorula toruloides]
MARQVLARASAASATHAKPTQPASNPRKRRQSSPSTSTALASSRAPAASTSLGTLAFDDEGADDAADADVLASSDDDEHDAFPELDLDGSAEEDADEEDSFDGSVHSDDEEDEMDDEELLRLELEAEQNEILSALSDAGDDDDPSDLDELIRRNTSKPDEDEPEPSAIPGQNKAIGEGRNGAAESDLPPDYMRRSRTVRSKLTGKEKKVWDDEIEPEYASDSSTEETTNRVGNIPQYWYDDLPHIGYDIDGKKVMRPATGDELDRFLDGVEDEMGGWASVVNKNEQEVKTLTEDELNLIQRLARAENPDESYDPYAPTIPYFTSQVMDMPLSHRPEPKSRFLPSKWEHKKVMKIVRAIRSGRITPRRPGAPKPPEKPRFYALWSADDDTPTAPHPMHMPAPKLAPPTHGESYNPPEEYLWTKAEEEEFDALEKEDKKGKVVPRKYGSLRLVPAYQNFVQERFERCLDLYLAPRALRRKPRLDIKDPTDLIPRLPSPQELRPFPTTKSVAYVHPNGVRVRCVSVDPTGMWVVTGAEDGEVRLWECAVGRCAMKWKVGSEKEPVYSVEWCPDREKCFFVAATANKIHLISPLPLISDSLAARSAAFALSAFNAASTDDDGNKIRPPTQPDGVAWRKPRDISEREEGRLVEVEVPGHEIKQVTWHKRGDYFATVSSPAGARSVLIHQLSKHHTQAPFAKLKGDVQRVQFHPSRPHFYVATQRHVRIYDLMKQQLVKTLNPGLKWISSLDIHPLGDNVLVGSYDRRLVWHDLDLSTTPYKTLKYHARALRSVAFHPSYPLFASSSDDGTIHIFHATVYADLLTNPLIVPLKVLRGHDIKDSLGVLDVKWHPKEPWVVSVGADGVGRLWCN